MNTTLSRIALFVCFQLLMFPSFSQQQWTLQQCVDHALKNNISVKQSAISVEQSQIGYTQNKMQMLPTLNGSASHNYNFGRSVDITTYQYTTEQVQSDNLSLNANLTLFNGFQLQNELKRSRLDYMASTYDLKKIQNDISLNVVSNFLQVLYAQEALTAARNQMDRSKQQRDRSKILTEAGSLTQGNLLDAESQLAADESGVISAENTLNLALLSLAQLMELETTDGFTVAAPATELPDISILAQSTQSIYQASLQHLPEIKSSELKMESAQKGLSIAKGGRSPRLSAFGSLGTNYSSAAQRPGERRLIGYFPNGSITTLGDSVLSPLYISSSEDTPLNDQLDQNYNRSAGFSLSIPIFNGWSTESNIRRARLTMINAQYSNDLQKQQVLKSIQQAYADASGAQKKYIAAQKSMEAMTASFGYIQKKYDAGILSSLEWLTSKNNFAKAESDLLQAKYDYIFRIKVLDFYAGKSLSL